MAASFETKAAKVGLLGRAHRVASGLIALIVLAILYYGIGMVWFHHIDDDSAFGEGSGSPVQGSHAVAVAAALIDREVNQNRWLANDPFFMPGYLLDNTPAFQTGIIQAISRFAIELTDQIARVRGSSQIDADTDSAAGRLKYPADVWIFEWSSRPVQPSSESQYRRAKEDLTRYNARLATGDAVFEHRADNLQGSLERIASDVGSSSAALIEHIDSHAGGWFDFHADELFYNNKGRLYAYYLILRGLGRDYEAIIAQRDLDATWAAMLESFRRAATLYPWMVTNGTLDGMAVPNHLAAQGFLLMRARTQLREVSNILQK